MPRVVEAPSPGPLPVLACPRIVEKAFENKLLALVKARLCPIIRCKEVSVNGR